MTEQNNVANPSTVFSPLDRDPHRPVTVPAGPAYNLFVDLLVYSNCSSIHAVILLTLYLGILTRLPG